MDNDDLTPFALSVDGRISARRLGKEQRPMTGREKIEAAFSADGATETAAVICYDSIYIRDHWSQLTECPWWYQESPVLEHQLAWRRDVHHKTGHDWFRIPWWYPREERESLSIAERPDGVFLANARTGDERRLEAPSVADQVQYERASADGYSHSKPMMPANTEDIDAALPLPTEVDPEAARSDGSADLADALLADVGKDLFPICHTTSPLWPCFSRWQFEDVMTKCVLQPDLVSHACQRFLRSAEAAVGRAAALGAKGIWIEECMTDMLSPHCFARLNAPFLAELVAAIRAVGLKSIYYYCGNPTGKWDSILGVGADAVSFEESKKGFDIDIETVVDRVAGRCVVLGNLDAIDLLPNAGDDELSVEIERQKAAGRRNAGRFVMSLGSPVTPGTPVSKVRRYCDLVHCAGVGAANCGEPNV